MSGPDSSEPSLLVYVTYYDDDSLLLARSVFAGVSWARFVKASPSLFFENSVLATTLWVRSSRLTGAHSLSSVLQEHQGEWEGVDYVGLLSPKATLKVGTDGLSLLQHVEQSVRDARHADVVALLAPGELLRRQAQMTHGADFVGVWHEVLRRLNFTEHEVRLADDLDVFFCNYWLARPHWLKRYLRFLRAAMGLMESDASLRSLLRGDARYSEGSVSVAKNVFGSPFYQYHPFICERLPVVFFALNDACVFRSRTRFISQRKTERTSTQRSE